MDHTPECDEQSEVLFVFTEDAADNQPPPSTSPPATSPPPAASPAPPHTDSADQSFWSEVYTLDPPHALMDVLTDLHIHRFLLHQHLTTQETPIGHQPLTDTLPQPIQRIIAIYHSNLQRAQHHTRLALNAIDTLARFPPAAYFTDPNFFTPDQQHINPHAASPPSNITPLRRYPLPTASSSNTDIQHAATQTTSPWVSVLDTHITAPSFHQSQQTTPRPDTHSRHAQTDINAIVHYPAFAGIPATPHTEQYTSSNTTANIPSTTSPTLTAAANKQPHERWQYVNLISTPTVNTPAQPEHTLDFPSPIGGTPRHRRSKTPPRSTTPTRTRQPDPRSGSPVPTPTSAPRPAPQQFLPTVQPLPKHPPPALHSAHQTPSTTNPLQPVPPATGWPVFQGAATNQTPVSAPPHSSPPPPHAWPSYYQVPPQQPPPTTLPPEYTTPPTNTAASATLLTARPSGYYDYDAQGRPLPLHQQDYRPEHDPWHADNH